MGDRETETAALLDDLTQLRSQVRGDRRETSVPLLTLAALALLSSVLRPVVGGVLLVYPAVLALLALGLYYRRRESTVGVGTAPMRWVTAGLAVLLVYVLVPWLAMLFLPPVAVVGITVSILGTRRRDTALVVGGVLAAAVSGLEEWFVISNRFWDLAKLVDAPPGTWWVGNAQPIVHGLLAASLLVAGLVAHRRETRRG